MPRGDARRLRSTHPLASRRPNFKRNFHISMSMQAQKQQITLEFTESKQIELKSELQQLKMIYA